MLPVESSFTVRPYRDEDEHGWVVCAVRDRVSRVHEAALDERRFA
jgi:hypothetical protein